MLIVHPKTCSHLETLHQLFPIYLHGSLFDLTEVFIPMVPLQSGLSREPYLQTPPPPSHSLPLPTLFFFGTLVCPCISPTLVHVFVYVCLPRKMKAL